MHWIDKLHVAKRRSQVADRQTQLAKLLAKALASVCCYQHIAPRLGHATQRAIAPDAITCGNLKQGINHGIASDIDVNVGQALTQERLPRALRRRKIEVRYDIGETAVDLFRKRMMFVASAQARLDMAERNAAIERHQRGCEDRGRIALCQHAVWLCHLQRFIEAENQTRGE